MKQVISASRRTDLVAFFPGWLSNALQTETVRVYGPSGRTSEVDLSPETVHTFVLWSKDFSNLIQDQYNLKDLLQKYGQLYFHFSITGLGGSFIERGVPRPMEAFRQLERLIKIAGMPERVSIRFDPLLFWKEGEKIETNLHFFETLAPKAKSLGIKDIRFSFTQWYGKALRRASKHDFHFIDPSQKEKKERARFLAQIAASFGLNLYACSQSFLNEVPGIKPSSCIDGRLLEGLHPQQEYASRIKDKSQRKECLCTESIDIGSYSQSCPHCCLYCYANPKI
jgi:hypothetical protein